LETDAWFGTGLMGAAFVERLLSVGRTVVVYNRTAAKATALERFGARAVQDPGEAARLARFLHIMLADDAAVDELLERIAGDIAPGSIVIDHSTVAPAPTERRFSRLAERGIAFLHAPVLMAPQTARSGGGLMMVSGAEASFAAARADLEPLAADLWYLGERPGKAATLKLFGNSILMFIVAGLADAYALAADAGVPASEAFELFEHFKPGGALEFRGKKMVERDFHAMFELAMARKDVRLMLETAAAGTRPVYVLPAIAARMDALIAAGHGLDDMAVLGIDSVTPNGAR
jgi:3-hydroxyisobutyrate dehydrogenase